MGYLNPIQLAAMIIVGMLLVVADAHSVQGQYWGEYHVGSNHSQKYYYLKTPNCYIGRVDGKRHCFAGERTVRHEFNENNTGGGISYEVTNNFEVGAGFFKNSFGNTAVYGGVDFHTSRARYVSVGVSLGPITGYKDTIMDTHWMILPNVVFGNDRVRTKIGYIPGDVSVTTLTVGIGF